MQTFLMSNAIETAFVGDQNQSYYDEAKSMSIYSSEVEMHGQPVCSDRSIVTSSKTEAAPGDDDPDPETEIMF